jgi:hypothetical protein
MNRQTDTDQAAQTTPAFMRDDIPADEPKFDPDTLVVGSPVVVSESNVYRRKTVLISARVTSKARVWIEVTATTTGRSQSWRLRLDTQDDGDDSNYKVRFHTPEQAAFRTARDEASSYLSDQGIRLDYGSPWKQAAATIRLARMIWAAENGARVPQDNAARIAKGK